MMNVKDEEIIAKYYELKKYVLVAEYYGCSAETIRRVLVKNNIPRDAWKKPKKEPKYHWKPVPYTDEEIIAAYKRLGTQDAVRDELGISHTSVYRVLKRNGVESNGRKLNGKGSRSGGGSPRKITDEELIEESKTMTRDEIAQKHCMCICNVDRKLHRLGIHCVPAQIRPTTGVRGRGKYATRIRAAGFGAEYDRSVTLPKLIKRDKGICQICGMMTDSSDRNSTNIGNYYPTLDHIVPIAKGGSHTWDNVQLAHMRCNSLKGAKYA